MDVQATLNNKQSLPNAGAATTSDPDLNNGTTIEVLPPTRDELSNSGGEADASLQTTTSVANPPIPESTIQHAKDASYEISSRLAELRKLEDSTVYVSEQVSSPMTNVLSGTLLTRISSKTF